MAGVESAFEPLHFHLACVFAARFSCHALVEPQSGAHLQGAALARLIQEQQKLHGMHEVRSLPEQSFPLVQRFPYQAQFAVFEVAQSAVNDARGTAGHSGGKIILLNQQRVLASASALPRHGYAINAPAYHHHLEVLVVQWRSWIGC